MKGYPPPPSTFVRVKFFGETIFFACCAYGTRLRSRINSYSPKLNSVHISINWTLKFKQIKT